MVGRQGGLRQTPQGRGEHVEVPSTVGGLAFPPKGFRLAIAQYNGVDLWFPNAAAKPEFLEWKGSHLASPSAPTAGSSSPRCRSRRCMAGASSTPSTCGCRATRAKVRSMDWTAAASGSPRPAPLSSFSGRSKARTDRWASEPDPRADRNRVVAVACHPKQPNRRGRLRGRHRSPGAVDDGAEILPAPAGGHRGDGARLERHRYAVGVRDGGGRCGGGGVGGVGYMLMRHSE